VNFNHFAVADVIFYAEFLQTLNCFAVKELGRKKNTKREMINR